MTVDSSGIKVLTTAQRIRKQYGSIRAALQHYIGLNLTILEISQHMDCSRTFVKQWAERLGVKIVSTGTRGQQRGRATNNRNGRNQYNARTI